MASPHTLRAGRLVATLLPALGGALGRFATLTSAGAVDWLRPAPADAASPLASAGFVAVPFFSRLERDRLTFDGRRFVPPAAGWGFDYPLHGFGWQRPWQVEATGPGAVTLACAWDGAGWPSAFCARQSFRLTEDRLDWALTLTNSGPSPMPAGLGFHPYFPRSGGAPVLSARADELPGVGPVRSGENRVYSGWNGAARLCWPDRRLDLAVTGPAARFLCLYAPAGEDFLCVEPVSHGIDAPNRPEAPGHLRLAPGESVTTVLTLRPSVL